MTCLPELVKYHFMQKKLLLTPLNTLPNHNILQKRKEKNIYNLEGIYFNYIQACFAESKQKKKKKMYKDY